MSKKTDWLGFRIDKPTKKIHLSRVKELNEKINHIATPSEINCRIIKLINHEEHIRKVIWKKVEKELIKEYRENFRARNPKITP